MAYSSNICIQSFSICTQSFSLGLLSHPHPHTTHPDFRINGSNLFRLPAGGDSQWTPLRNQAPCFSIPLRIKSLFLPLYRGLEGQPVIKLLFLFPRVLRKINLFLNSALPCWRAAIVRALGIKTLRIIQQCFLSQY